MEEEETTTTTRKTSSTKPDVIVQTERVEHSDTGAIILAVVIILALLFLFLVYTGAINLHNIVITNHTYITNTTKIVVTGNAT